MLELIIKYRRVLVVLIHAALIVLAYSLSFASRFDIVFYQSPEKLALLTSTLIPLLLIRMASYWYFDLFRGLWKYVSVKDLLSIVKASVLGTLLFAFYIFEVARGEGFPRSIFIIDLAYNILLLSGIRVAVRIYREEVDKDGLNDQVGNKNILIVGAGDAGEMILREMRNNPRLGYNPVGFVDDDRGKHNSSIHGVRVLGNTRDICRLSREYAIEEVIIALPSVTGKTMRRIVNTCKRADVRFKTLPYIGDLIDGNVSISQIREVDIEDLLGREPVSLDMSMIGKELAGKVIVVTGAAGSIGSELVRQAARFNPEKIILFERSENDLYHFEIELKKRESNTKFISFIGDVKDKERVRRCLDRYRPAYIYHAAAYKHVPMMELNPTEAVKNNILGTKVMVDLACEYNVEKFVLISTDKAVRPTNIMGATKRVAELILQEKAVSEGCTTQFIAVRFGNVLGSNGSVIPLLKEQIACGGPVTVTHPEITRYFMTIPEAVQLVIQAGAMGTGGELFLLEMGEPVRIKELAENLIKLSGLEPGRDIEIIYTGLRPGEKLFEELLIEGEGIKATHHDKIYVLHTPIPDSKLLQEQLGQLEISCKEWNDVEIRSVLKRMVPEFSSSFKETKIENINVHSNLDIFQSSTIH